MQNRTFSVSSMCLLVSSLLLILPATAVDAKRPAKDKGEARMKIGDTPWVASRAGAYYKKDQLEILASWSKTIEGKRVRQALTLSISDFAGPGTYELKGNNSSFTAVGLNLQQLEGESDAAAQKAVLGALSKSTVLLLKGSNVTITSEEENQVKGTFSWPGRHGQAPITEGVFRAVVKKRE